MSRFDDTYDWGGLLVQDLVSREVSRDAEVLDVGPCWGKYRILLSDWPNMDACEVWQPYVEQENLCEMYRRVYLADICDLVESDDWHHYDLVVMGDVFEHIERSRAKAMLGRVLETCGEVLVVVPYLYEQGPEHGNPHQCHRQDDLTPELMGQEYPELRLVATELRNGQPFKGLYRRR